VTDERQVYRGQTVSIIYEIKDKDGVLTDLDSSDIILVDGDGSEISSPPDLVKTATGIYEWNYTVPTDGAYGVWKVLMEGVIGSYTEKQLDAFEVLTDIV